MEEDSAEQQKRPPLLLRAKRSGNRWMRRKGWELHTRQLVFHYVQLIWEQLSAMLPITLLQVSPVRHGNLSLAHSIFAKRTSLRF
jgi:hypothetical protein